MKKWTHPMIVTLCVIFAQCLPVHASNPWKKVMDKDGIQSFSRHIEGSDILEFRAVTVVDAPIEVVGEVVRDIAHYPEWVPFCSKGEVLERMNLNDMTVYIYLDFPWPVADRDIVPTAVTTYDPGLGRATTSIMDTQAAQCPPREGVVRLPEFRGTYVFEYITRESTGVIYTYRADVGGKLPTGLVNTFTKYNMYETFENLRKMAAKPLYHELGAKSPDRGVVTRQLQDHKARNAVVIARLREFVRSDSFLDMLADYPALHELMEYNQGQAVRDILYGWGSEQGKKDAIKSILSAYMHRKTQDQAKIRAVISDEKLIGAILNGEPEGYCITCAIEKIVRPDATMAASK